MAYVETLFGHQDEVVDVAAGVGGQERCISVGARDRTARLWKVVDETQLVFRGPSKSIINAGVSDKALSIHSVNGADPQKKQQHSQPSKGYAEGSLDCVCVLDNETFVTGSDAGTLCLWHISKKKPIHSIPLAHGLDPALPLTETSAERDLSRVAKEKAAPERQPRWITALATIPGTDVVVSGSWDGVARVWRVISPQAPGRGYGQVPAPKGMLEAVGMLGERTAGKTGDKVTDGISGQDEPDDPSVGSLKGIVNDLSVFERGKRGEESLCVVAAVGTEHRLGRWKKLPTGKSGAVIFEVPQKWKGQASRKQKQKQRKRKKKREGEADFPEPSWPVESDTEVS